MTGAWGYYPEHDDWLDEHYADIESFENHYADEIDGRVAHPLDDIPPATVIAHAPGQLQFNFRTALRFPAN